MDEILKNMQAWWSFYIKGGFGCSCFSVLGLRLIHVNKRDPGVLITCLNIKGIVQNVKKVTS